MSNIVYFNATFSNTSSNEPIKAEYYSQSNNIILNNQSDYYGSVIRVNVNQLMVPIGIFKVQTPVNNINLGVYSFTMTYQNHQSQQIYLIFQPTNSAISPPLVGTQTQSLGSSYYYIYNYQNMIDMMNVALKSAYENLVSVVGGGVLSANNYPYIVFDNTLGQVILYAHSSFDLNIANPVKIYCNTEMNPYLHGFRLLTESYNDTQGKNYLVSIKTLPDQTKATNTTTNSYIFMKQEASCLSYWNTLRNVYITSSLSVFKEVFYNPQSNITYQNILTDYIPDLSGPEESLIVSKQFIYNADSLFRMFEFSSNNSPLTNIDLAIVWADNDGNVYPLYLYKGYKCDLKLMFVKKDFFNNMKL